MLSFFVLLVFDFFQYILFATLRYGLPIVVDPGGSPIFVGSYAVVTPYLDAGLAAL
jgi:hypothetical protein